MSMLQNERWVPQPYFTMQCQSCICNTSVRRLRKDLVAGDTHPIRFLIADRIEHWTTSTLKRLPDFYQYPTHLHVHIAAALKHLDCWVNIGLCYHVSRICMIWCWLKECSSGIMHAILYGDWCCPPCIIMQHHPCGPLGMVRPYTPKTMMSNYTYAP